MNTSYPPFSLTIAVYKNDHPQFVREALDSILQQTLPPAEIVITQDGPVPEELSEVLKAYVAQYECIQLLVLPKNVGLGLAHQAGVLACHHELIAIMDSDDCCVPTRFEQQVAYFQKHPETDILGGNIAEFMDNIDNVVGIRTVPTTDADIKRYLRKRDPLNHMTVMFKKAAVLAAGNYQHWHYAEDTFLWCRMMLNGAVFANLPEILVKVRVNPALYQRRGGLSYFKSEARLVRWKYDHKIVNFPMMVYNIAVRFVVQVLMPNKLRGFIFQKMLRKKPTSDKK